MELRVYHSKHRSNFGSPDLKSLNWLDRRIVVGKYSYSVGKLLATLGGALAFFIVFFFVLGQYQNYRNNPDAAVQRETRALILKIGRFMELPQGEDPTLATVSDRSKLKGQDFFARAQNGDRVLIYTKARKAILYRPASEKIIEVTNLTSGNQADSCPAPPAENPPAFPGPSLVK